MGDPSESTERRAIARWEVRLSFARKWAGVILPPIVGFGIAFYAVRHLANEPPDTPATHVILMALFGVLGLTIAFGKRTLAGIAAITAGIQAWRGGSEPPKPPPTGGV